MLNEDERHARIGGQAPQKIGKGLQAASRSANTNDGERLILGRTYAAIFTSLLR